MKTLEDYMKENLDRDVIDHAVRCIKGPNGEIDFYIHPAGVDGDTLDFTANGNTLSEIPNNHSAGSRPPQSEMNVVVSINGKSERVGHLVSYRQIATLSGYPADMNPSCIYRRAGSNGEASGILTPAQEIEVNVNTVFECMDTSNA